MASKADKGDVQMKKRWARLLAAGLAAALTALLAGEAKAEEIKESIGYGI